MKTLFWNLLLIMFFLGSCGNDSEPYRLPLEEFPPIKIYFTYTNMDGEDLLNPSNPNNILGSDISVRFKGVEYFLNESYEENPNGKGASHVNFQGLRLQSIAEEKYAIVFGDLDGSAYYKDEFLSVSWGSNPGYSLYIYSIWTWENNGMPNFYRIYKRNNKVIEKDTSTPIIDCIFDNYAPNVGGGF